MTYYNRDVDRTIQKTVAFCGKGVMTTSDNKQINEGCHMQVNNEDGLDVEACFCNTDGCNSSNLAKINLLTMLIVLILNQTF